MKPRTLLILALLVVGLGAFIWFFERDIPSTEERRELEARILPLQTDDIQAIVLEGDGYRVRLERSSTETKSLVERTWKVAEPVAAPADVDKIAALLRQLTELESEREIDFVDPAAVGLDDPAQRIVLETVDTRHWKVDVGSPVPATDSVVLRLDGNRYFVGSGAFLTLLDEQAGEWRSRDLLAFSDEDVARLDARGPGGELSVVRRDGRFILESPVSDEANEGEVVALLGALDELVVAEFLDDPPSLSGSGLAPAEVEITLEVDGHVPVVLLVGSVAAEGDERRFLALGDRTFIATTDLPELLEQPAEIWQSRQWTSLEPFEVDSAIVRQGGDEMLLERRGGSWFRDGEEIAYSDVADLLDAVAGLDASGVVPLADASAGGGAELDIELVGNGRSESLELASVTAGGFVALRSGREFALVVSADSAAAVGSAVNAVRDAPAEEADADDGDSGQEAI